MKMRRKRCRLWWPTNLLSSSTPKSSNTFNLLFGWFIDHGGDDSGSSSSSSLDIVVAFARDESAFTSNTHFNLQGILHETNRNMPVSLQDKCTFSLLGCCVAGFEGNGLSLQAGSGIDIHRNSTCQRIHTDVSQNTVKGMYGRSSCLCRRFDKLLKQNRMASVGNNSWVQLVYGHSETMRSKVGLLPRLHHIHWKKEIISELDLHVIVYEIPKFGRHHYSLGVQNTSEQVETSFKKPKWIEDLHSKPSHLDLHAAFVAVNSVNATEVFFGAHLDAGRSSIPFHVFCMISAFAWKLLAISLASFGTFIYVILQASYRLLSFLSHSCIYVSLGKIFCNTCKNIRNRCSQFLHWPIYLQDYGLRPQPCVEYAEKAALHRHSIWSSLVVDVFLGNVVGFVLWFHAEQVCLWLSNFTDDITNYVLRTGCVWLMGNPAGFKLNTELAGVLGMISLNAIQIWSTLWFLMGFLFIHFIKVVALSGILFGLTTPAALTIDIISLLTTHLSALHWLISLLYSWQILAIASLWRLFRGRKWNPLRQRLDSYDYTVEQHVVGSLLFTPLLLLLPTTSGFYIFFTIMITTISFICSVIEVAISVIHATPYNKIFLWLLKKRRFPFGIWFEIISCQCNANDFSEVGSISKVGSSFGKSKGIIDTSDGESTILASFLHSNFLDLAAIVWPHYRCVFSAFSRSSMASSAYGVLTGKSIPNALRIALPSMLPWVSIPCKDYWRLCRDAVLACKADCKCHLRQ